MASVTTFALSSVAMPAPAVAANPLSTPAATLIARRFDDGLDSRNAASSLSSALAAIGYASAAHTGGRTAQGAWEDGKASAVFGVFGHANAGIAQTDEGANDVDEILAAGLIGDVSFANIWFWENYLHVVDVDDMRLAIFAGCYTGNTDPYWGSFGASGEQRGVDSIVGWTDLVYYPALCTTCDYSGNRFWSRFSVYARNGDTVSTALAKARNDLVAAEGNAGGWNLWRFDGAVAQPGTVRLNPVAHGNLTGSEPPGADAVPFAGSPVRSQSLQVGEREVVDVETVTGVSYRVDRATGELLWLTAPASTDPADPASSEEAAEARAVAFAERHVPWFRAADGIVTRSRPSREDGDALFAYEWRMRTPAGPGPGIVDIEVDRRTGEIAYFSATRVTPSHADFRVARDEAVEAARAVPGGATATVVSVAADVWNTARWTVTLDRAGTPLTPDLLQVVVDARSGEVLEVRAT